MLDVSRLEHMLANLPGPDAAALQAVSTRASQVLRPTGAFARLDRVAAWLASWQRTSEPRVERPAVLVFAADHGVAAEGVSAYPAETTAAMFEAVERGAATIVAAARTLGASVQIDDVGVGKPTGNLRIGDATSASEAAATWTGPSTGVQGEALEHKRAVVRDAIERVGDVTPLEALRRVGGRELAAMAGAAVAARRRSIPVVIDGFICTAAMAPLHIATPGSLDHCIAGHCSAEPGHQQLLDRLDLDPLLRLDLRLGEGSGALAAVPIIKIAAAVVTDVATFEEWGLA